MIEVSFMNKHTFIGSLQDQLAADMYNFFSKEGEYACYYVMVSSPSVDQWYITS